MNTPQQQQTPLFNFLYKMKMVSKIAHNLWGKMSYNELQSIMQHYFPVLLLDSVKQNNICSKGKVEISSWL